MVTDEGLNVIALVSGGKDSFYNLLHCIHHGHRIVALANLFPDDGTGSGGFQAIDPTITYAALKQDREEDESDLNSFMYQTVGHEVIPLYAAATGLPLYRLPICGTAVNHELDYDFHSTDNKRDETESIYSLLQEILKRHPEANAVSAGAILSTYQRTRVESVALRLSLTPLAYLWKYPELPAPVKPVDDAQLLKDMTMAGLDARIIKVASAGLDEESILQSVTTFDGAERVKRALRKFGASGGAVLGEGGEFETIVIDGPAHLFKKRIKISKANGKIIPDGGGTAWIMFKEAELEEKPTSSNDDSQVLRVPCWLDDNFKTILHDLESLTDLEEEDGGEAVRTLPNIFALLKTQGDGVTWFCQGPELFQWTFCASEASSSGSIESETALVVDRIRQMLLERSLEPSHISNTIIILRNLSDFPRVNTIYGRMFSKPNPPSRVTVSCGELLPGNSNIMVLVTVNNKPTHYTTRRGLHVQSRSYWAPANIGPYSQAIGMPIAVKVTDETGNGGIADITTTAMTTKTWAWSIAGQIPLVPSTMDLPSSLDKPDKSRAMQVVLSLQHLWRIAKDLKVQLWTSAVAYFPKTTHDSDMNTDMRHNVRLAAKAWTLAHGTPEDDDEEDSELDLWDLKYNSQHMSLGADDGNNKSTSIPDWSVWTLRHQNEPKTCIPPFFAIEVEQLPRGAAVEWHAHIGLSGLDSGTVEMINTVDHSTGWRIWHMLAKDEDTPFLHTVMALGLESSTEFGMMVDDMKSVYRSSVQTIGFGGVADSSSSGTSQSPYITYLDVASVESWVEKQYHDNESGTGEKDAGTLSVLPCHSIWSPTGRRMRLVSLWKCILKRE